MLDTILKCWVVWYANFSVAGLRVRTLDINFAYRLSIWDVLWRSFVVSLGLGVVTGVIIEMF